jgi:HEAT repeat protein
VDHRSDYQLREEAIVALGDIGDPAGVEALIETVEDDTADDSARALAATSLAQIGDPLAIEPFERILAGLASENVEVTTSALPCCERSARFE